MVRKTLEGYKLWGFKFQEIDFGRIPPRINGIKVYKTSSDDEIVMDIDVGYRGDILIEIGLLKVDASVADVQVK